MWWGNGETQASVDGVFFPTYSSPDAPDAQAFGSIEREGPCILLRGEAGAHLPLWPEGFYFDGQAIRNGDAVVAKLGARVELAGGEVDPSVAEGLIGEGIPSECSSPIPFMVSNVAVSDA